MKKIKYLLMAFWVAAMISVAGCGGGGGGGVADSDGDGIPDNVDSSPNNPTQFASFSRQVLSGLAGGVFNAGIGVNNVGVAGFQAVGISDNGVAQEIRGVRWNVANDGTPSAPVELNPLAGNNYSAAYAINDSRIVVGESAKLTDTVAVFWAADSTTPTEMPLLGATGPSAAYSINGSGGVVGEALNSGGKMVPVFWKTTATAPVSLPLLSGGTSGAAYFISADGSKIVGESQNSDAKMRAVVWKVGLDGSVGSPTDLGVLSGHDRSVAMGVSASGQIVGESENSATGETHGVLWVEGVLFGYNATDLGTAGVKSSVSAINDFNKIAGWTESSGSSLASLWFALSKPANMSNVVLSETSFSQALGINSNGVVVGMLADKGFVAVPK